MSNVLALQQQQGGALAQSPAAGRMAVSDIIAHVQVVQEVMRTIMKPDVHYGVIPGTDKPTLLKPGAELLCMTFRIADSYSVEDLSTADRVRYRVTCIGTHQLTGAVLGTGMGEASSGEEKYKWRKAYKPEFEATPENLRRKKSGFNKKTNESYETYQVRTDPDDLANTVLKMANKRAKMAMTLNVTAASDCFTQDLEDMDEALRQQLAREGRVHTEDVAPEPTYYLQADFDANLAIWKKVIAKGTKPEDVIAKINSANQKTPLSEAQKEVIRGLAAEAKPAPAPAAAPAAAEATVAGPAVQLSHGDVLEKLRAAKDEDALNAVLDLANSIQRTDEEQAAEEACYDECLAKLRG